MGSIDKIVVDPATTEVTHVVVRKGFLFPEDLLIGIDYLTQVDEETALLSETADDFDKFIQFEESNYVSLKRGLNGHSSKLGLGMSYIYYPPIGARPYLDYPHRYNMRVKKTVRNIPENAVVIDEGTTVTSKTGDPVGHVEKTFTDVDGNVSHILISQGLFFKTKRLIPAPWTDKITDREIRLCVSTEVIENLPDEEA